MPAPALPQPWHSHLPGSVAFRRVYRDALGRPMTGTVTLTGQNHTEMGGAVIPPAPVAVEIVNGVVEVNLPPDTYTLTAALRTADGSRVSDSATVVVGTSQERQ
jgi:hypothetical protein